MCERCGSRPRLDMERHHQLASCRLAVRKKALRARGWGRCSEYWNVVQRGGAPMEKHPVSLAPRPVTGTDADFSFVWWAPSWAIRVARLRSYPPPSTVPAEDRVRWIRMLVADPEMCAAFETISALKPDDDSVILDFLQTRTSTDTQSPTGDPC
jgi:hypothetical protein